MVVKVKNMALKKSTFRRMKVLDDKALKCYKKGDMKCGQKFEKASDNLYAKNYNKMFKIIKG